MLKKGAQAFFGQFYILTPSSPPVHPVQAGPLSRCYMSSVAFA